MIKRNLPELMWYPIAKHLSEFIEKYTLDNGDKIFTGIDDLTDFTITVGSMGSAREYPCLEIIFDSESKNSPTTPKVGNISLWLDFYINSISDESEDAYKQAYIFTNDLTKCIKDWIRVVVEELGVAMNATISDVLSDGDTSRPKYQIRVILNIDWRK